MESGSLDFLLIYIRHSIIRTRMKALSMLEHLVEPDHRRVVELNFRICLVYELVSKIRDAISYCAKAISLCKSRIQNLKSSKDALLAGIDGGDASAAEGGSENSTVEKELEQLTSILPDLEKKLEDLSEANPSADMDEMVKAIASMVIEVMPKAASFTSSQIATSSNGFDSSVMSTAATTGSSGSTVTDLGVVGRGVKRASIKPISVEPAAKKPALDSPSLQGDNNINSEVVPATQTDESS
ncbi:histone-binding protein N1/N2 [Zea mays]|uniref:Tetratricopeptide repeat (TPR)-like superfamily protein n=2 Tax=Zea mays TaxID=4577 RepID=A0A1D6Q0W3_MAIZE|nr:histone-binding protein N1/N2 [Zea mays]AQK52274.1 Tetratricopeptide repeat (TPR)-like superfamily protein [Zea mays]|eukprot:XP_008678557.1 histone-binding protein N1/N2 [Zea mays]